MYNAGIWQPGPLYGGLSGNSVIELDEALRLYVPLIRAAWPDRLEILLYLLPDVDIGIALQEADAYMHSHREVDLISPSAVILRLDGNAVRDP